MTATFWFCLFRKSKNKYYIDIKVSVPSDREFSVHMNAITVETISRHKIFFPKAMIKIFTTYNLVQVCKIKNNWKATFLVENSPQATRVNGTNVVTDFKRCLNQKHIFWIVFGSADNNFIVIDLMKVWSRDLS